MDKKTCTLCGKTKLLSAFHNNLRNQGGKQARCKDCIKAYNRARYQANKDKIIARSRAYYEANKDEYADRSRAYRRANRDRILVQQKEYRNKTGNS